MAIKKGWSFPSSMGFAKGGAVRVSAHYRKGGHHKSSNVHTHLKHDAHDPEEGPMKHIKQHGGTSPLLPYKKGGMHINPAHKGKFTRRGISVEKGLHSKSKVVREEANFARMAKRHFKPLARGGSVDKEGGHERSTERIENAAPGFKERKMHEDARGGHVKMRHGGHVAGRMGHKDVDDHLEKLGHRHHDHVHGHDRHGHQHYARGGRHRDADGDCDGDEYKRGGRHLPKRFREEEGHPHKMHKAAGGLAGIEPRTPRIGTRSRHMNPLRASISPGVRASSIRPMGGLGGVGVMKRGGKAGR